ncbi:peptidase P60 [Caulobacter mirabilis]|uniref:peptidase P60 n=1 Tax=Caulobacter mirabilis TaxID=69666 RepID=UPI001FEB9866|nr:peptidase P60 [Caulobacter mirabilis]
MVAAARRWIGTPYRHQASLRGVGCDCLGLVRGLWRELAGDEPEPPPPYRPDWAETDPTERLLAAAERHLRPVPIDQARPGDILLFRMSPDACVKHCAVLSATVGPGAPDPRIVHAYWGRAVVESWLGPWWRRRRAAAFAFPFVNE